MTSLELKKMKVELMRVSASRAELELRVDERLDEIERIKEHIKISQAKEIELADKIKGEENG